MKINTVLFDMGGTLEDISFDTENRLKASKDLMEYLDKKSISLKISSEEFLKILQKRNNEYASWSEKTFIEASPCDIWSKWHLKDFNIEERILKEIGEELAVMWETKFYRRKCKKEALEMLKSLKNRGYKLGIVSNTSSQTQVFTSLELYGIREYFQWISLSSIHGYRKPRISIFTEALEAMKSIPNEAVYVGDTISRDVIGSKAAGFALAIQIKSFLTNMKDVNIGDHGADYVIENLNEIVNVLDKVNS